MPSDDLPHLCHFLGGYFHEDWDLDDPDEAAVVDRFMQHANDERLNGARSELDRLLAMPLDERRLSEVVLRDLGCYYNPKPDVPMRDWLRSVAARLGNRMS